MDGITYRQAVPADAEQIAAVHIATWQHAYRGLLPDQFLTTLSPTDRAVYWRSILDGLTADSAVWVGELQGQVIAFCHVGPSRDGDAHPATGELYSIYVDSRFLGQGIGTALMHIGGQTLRDRGCRKATLWVLANSERGRSFYERCGWHADGTTKTEALGDASINTMRYCVFY